MLFYWKILQHKQEIIISVLTLLLVRSRDSVVGIAAGYGLDDRGVGVRVPVRSRIFTSPIFQTGSGVHPIQWVLELFVGG
jgi:hypothetical protein